MNGDLNTVASTQSCVPLISTRVSPFQPDMSTTHAMAAPSYLPHSSFRPNVPMQVPFAPSPASVKPYEGDATKAIGTSFSSSPAGTMALIRRLPLSTTEESLRLMTVFSKEHIDIQVLSPDQSDDAGFRSAILRFETPVGAQEAKSILDGKSNISNDAKMIVQILSSTPTTGAKRFMDSNASTGPSTASSSVNSSTASCRQTSRFNGSFQSLDTISPTMNVGPYGGTDMPGTERSHCHGIFSTQSPIGNYLADHRSRMSGKKLINDSVDKDEAGELLKNPFVYAENGSLGPRRRATAPQLPIHARMAGLSLACSQTAGPSSMPSLVHSSLPSLLSHSMPPTVMGGAGPNMGFTQHYRHHHFPPANPADQNPPCNTLYVGNLPIDTSEEELKAMFSKQRGYKRLCFRTKQNGPMCFVEFEDVSAATKALTELYGHPLHNSVKGGIRLSFSKNPLGVRSGQTSAQSGSGTAGSMTGTLPTHSGAFTTASGPPPGLSVPPGLGLSRPIYSTPLLMTGGNNHYGHGFANSSHTWNAYNGGIMAAGVPVANTSSGYPPRMMGR